MPIAQNVILCADLCLIFFKNTIYRVEFARLHQILCTICGTYLICKDKGQPVAIDHNSQAQEMFEVVEALYQEAELTLPKETQSSPAIAVTTQEQDKDEDSTQIAVKPTVIQSRKARVKTAPQTPIFTRISDLYEEAEAVKILAQEEVEAGTPIDEPHKDEVLADLLPDDTLGGSDPFLPASFDAPQDQPEDSTDKGADSHPLGGGLDDATDAALADALAKDETALSDATDKTLAQDLAQDDDFIIPATFGATDDELNILAGALAQDAETQQDGGDASEDSLTISHALEPSVSLDDAIEQLEAETEDAPQAAVTEEVAGSEADALAALDASRPQADEEMTQQLEDVRSAVVQAQSASSASLAEEPETAGQELASDVSDKQADAEADAEADAKADDSLADVKAGPELVAFIGETVRDVLDEQLPSLVRGLVDEALGERQGRYGRSDTPHIGLRTKPSRH